MAKEENLIKEYLRQGEKLMESKLYERAMVEFNKAFEIDMTEAAAGLKSLFEQCIASGNYDGVIAIGSNLIQQNEKDVELANLLGNTYRKMGNRTQAEKLYDRCLHIDPQAKFPSYNYAAAMANVELYDNQAVSAISEFESMKSYKLPDNQKGEKKLLEIQKQLNEDEEANQTEEPNASESTEGGDTPPAQDPNNKKKAASKDLEINPTEIFKYIRNEVKMHSLEGIQMLLYLGFYCLENNFPQIGWKIFTRLSFFRPQNEEYQCWVALAHDLRGQQEVAIERLVSLLGKDYYHRYANVNMGYLYQQQESKLLSRKYYLFAKSLLEKTEGCYDMHKFRALADQDYENTQFKKALDKYEILLSEQESIELYGRIISINLELGKYDDSVWALHQMKKLDPKSEEIPRWMEILHMEFLAQAEELRGEGTYAKAVKFYERCLDLQRTKEVVQECIRLYEMLKNHEKVKSLKRELYQIEEEEREREKEENYFKKLEIAKNFEEHHLPYKAIRAFEEALTLNPEKEVLFRLVELYKKTKQRGMIESMTVQYNRLVEHKNRMIQYKKDAERRERIKAEDGEEELEEN